MRDYIQPIVFQITSTRSYIVLTLSQKRGRSPRSVEYAFIVGVLYLIALFLLHKIYRFFVRSVLKQKTNYYFACDTILYQYQQNKNNEDLNWIQTTIKKGSYDQSYTIFLEKAEMLESEQFKKQLRKTHTAYINASRRKKFCGLFLVVITLGIYKLFLEH